MGAHSQSSHRGKCLGWAAASLAALAYLGTGPVLAQDAGLLDSVAQKIEPPFAWNRADVYQPPDFEAFFPDDVEAGKRLDLMIEGKLATDGVDDRLALIRQGLRNTSHYQTTLLGSVGNQFIWNKQEQDPRAIELMYHASAADSGEIAHYALYHGPTVVSGRTPNLVRALMEQYQSLDVQMQERIAWGMRTYGDQEHTRKLLLHLLNDYQNLDESTTGAALDTYQAVFGSPPPDMERFENIGKWVLAFHRTDLAADHPRAAEILRGTLDRVFRDRPERLIDFVTRVDDEHETAVALIQGVGARVDLATYLSTAVRYRIDFNEMLSARTLQELRLREFARHLPQGLPENSRPNYTRPPLDESYAYQAEKFVAPNFSGFFADDVDAAIALDAVYADGGTMNLTDRQLLDLFRRGVRRSGNSPNVMFGWISSALGWPRDPLLTEILYQAVDPEAPFEVRKAGIYYGFGLGTNKTENILEAMYQVYLAPPLGRKSGEMRSRILWGVRDHEDDKHYLATRFEASLRDHAALSDEALLHADRAYRELTDHAPPNAEAYASRGVYLVMFQDEDATSIDDSQKRMQQRLGQSPHLIKLEFASDGDEITVMAAVRGRAGTQWLVDNLQSEPKLDIFFADLLTLDLINQAENNSLRGFAELLSGNE